MCIVLDTMLLKLTLPVSLLLFDSFLSKLSKNSATKLTSPPNLLFTDKIRACLCGIHIFLLSTELHKFHTNSTLKVLPPECDYSSSHVQPMALDPRLAFPCSDLWEKQACSHAEKLARILNSKRLWRERLGSPIQLFYFVDPQTYSFLLLPSPFSFYSSLFLLPLFLCLEGSGKLPKCTSKPPSFSLLLQWVWLPELSFYALLWDSLGMPLEAWSSDSQAGMSRWRP